MKPSRYCLIGFCLFKVSGSLQEFIWSVAENETATLFPRLIILIPLSFCSHSLFFVCLQSVPFGEIKTIRPDLRMKPGWTNFQAGTYFVSSHLALLCLYTTASHFSFRFPFFILLFLLGIIALAHPLSVFLWLTLPALLPPLSLLQRLHRLGPLPPSRLTPTRPHF